MLRDVQDVFVGLAFALLFVADVIVYYYRATFDVPLPPVGIIAYALTLISFLLTLPRMSLTVARSQAVIVSLFVFFLVWDFLIISLSEKAEWSDYYLVALYGLYFFLGTAMYVNANLKGDR